jgi:hypothetical protein
MLRSRNSGGTMRVGVLVLMLLFCVRHAAFAWGELGHRAISAAAEAQLDPTTIKALASIVGSGDELPVGSLERLSLWPDQIKPLAKNDDATIPDFSLDDLGEARDFFHAHPDNPEWHYLDLPLGSMIYPDAARGAVLPFTRPHDIVHMIQRCIDVLETEGESPEFTKLQALRWLLHLVEDIHQPLHVASGYYNTAAHTLAHPQRVDDPAAVTRLHAKNDRGGNLLLFLEHPRCPNLSTPENLHSVWDYCLVEVVNGAQECVSSATNHDPRHLTDILNGEMRSAHSDGYRTTGDIHRWAEQWATDSLQVARTHVLNVELADGCLIRSEQPPHEPLHVQSRIAKPSSKKQYLHSHKDVAKTQLTKAAVRLADLLNHITWK